MPFYQVGSIKYFQFSSLNKLDVYHAIFARQGGISPHPWSSLNFGASVGDDIDRVRQNKTRALKAIGLTDDGIYDVYQVHSTDIVVVNRSLISGESHIKADGMITQQPRLTLLMRFADCVPILLVDPVHHAIAIIHAGWLGTVNKIVEKAVRMLSTNFGSDPDDIYAGIGPSIGPDHYQVGNDVLEKVRLSFRNNSDQLIEVNHDKTYFNLWKANQIILNEIGVDKIEISSICTQCNMNDWYSHRGEKGKTGRFGAVIGLE